VSLIRDDSGGIQKTDEQKMLEYYFSQRVIDYYFSRTSQFTNDVSNAISVFGAAAACVCITLFLFILRRYVKNLRPCLIGFGFLPVFLFSGLFAALPRLPGSSVPLLTIILLLLFFLVPSFPLALVISIGASVRKVFGWPQIFSERVFCLGLLVLHFLGLLWAYALLTHKGSF